MAIFFWQRWLKRTTSAQWWRGTGIDASFPARRRSPLRNFVRPVLEPLEDRVLLSTASPTYIIYTPPGGQPYQSPGPVGFTPQQIRTAYGIDQLYGIIGDGAGQTIAIVDAYDEPAFVDSTDPNFVNSDLHKFDVQFGIPDPPSFKKLDQNGGTNLPGTDPAGPGKPNWEGEEALDVEWVHALAPGANIILIETNSPNDLYTGVATAAQLPGVSVVSMSWGSDEFNGEQSLDSTFVTPPGHIGVTFLAATGDSGSPGGYPAYSPNVIAVGGTSLKLNANNTYNSESGWSGSGGGISQFEPEPAYQQSVQQTGKRTIPDVAFLADPNTGVAVYDSYNNGTSTPWEQIGGTSLACPSWAALIAIVDQGLVENGVPTLDGATQTLPDLYKLYQSKPSDFHDITTGSNGGFSAKVGYDEVTGMGTPVANLLVPDLVALSGLHVHATLSGVAEGQPLTSVAVATFTDPSGSQPIKNYTASITWGDGAVTTGTIVATGGNTYAVLGSHTYINAGTYSFSVSVRNTVKELSGSSTISLQVADRPLRGFAQAINGQVGEIPSNLLVAVFEDTDPTPRGPSQYTASIQWLVGGLPVTTVGRIVPLFGTNTFAVFGDYPYGLPIGGLLTIRVTIRDVGGAAVVVDSSLAVDHNPAIPPLFPQSGSDADPAGSAFASLQDALTNLLLAERLFFVAFVFGTATEQQNAFANLLNAFFAYRAAVLQFDMNLPGSQVA